MDFNSIVYPAPEPTSDVNFFLESEDPEMRKMLLLIDPDDENKNQNSQIPCIYLENNYQNLNKVNNQV